MITAIVARISTPRSGLAPGTLRRGLIAGSAWGLSMAALSIAHEFLTCGGVCLPDAAITTALSTSAGIVAIGPLAVFGRRGAV
jgi:hypothetical protein